MTRDDLPVGQRCDRQERSGDVQPMETKQTVCVAWGRRERHQERTVEEYSISERRFRVANTPFHLCSTFRQP